MKSDLYFRCEECGGRILRADPKNYRAAIDRDPPPLRKVIFQREKETGRQLCGACMEKWEHSHRQ